MIDANETSDEESERRAEIHSVQYDPESAIGPSETLVIAIADIAGVDPLELEPLYRTVHPETLNDFVGTDEISDVGGQITFTFGTYHVTVHASGLLEIEPE